MDDGRTTAGASGPQIRRRWFQVSLRDLMLGIVLISVGLGTLLANLSNAFNLDWNSTEGHIALFGITFASGAMIGAGLLSPFKLKTVGMIVGFVLVWPALLFFEL
jgi:hypothetical protein